MTVFPLNLKDGPDVCDIGRLQECIDAGAHDPLVFPNGEVGKADMRHGQTGVKFGRAMACRRCGLTYWEPTES